MTFPKIEKKHLLEALFTAHDFVDYKKWEKNKFPKRIIITYQEHVLNYFLRMYRGQYTKTKVYSKEYLYTVGKVGFIRMAGIGAPHVVATIEEFIALGAKKFITIGSAGGLDKKGIFVCTKAVRDEGTSYHYVKDSMYAYPDPKLTRKIEKVLEKNGITFTKAASWTIDTPYRETKQEITKYKRMGVKTVEMEASAVFALAKLRKVQAAALFVVSDVLGETWDPQFHTQDFKKTLNKMTDIAMECLTTK